MVASRPATRSRRQFAFLVSVVLLTTTQRADAPAASQYYIQRAIADYIDSGRYQADVANVVAHARGWLEQRAPTVKRPAIVLDIDETSLSNWPAYRVNGWVRIKNGRCDLKHGPCNLRKWQKWARAPAIPSTLELAQHAERLGVAVFFIKGRVGNQLVATERNLREQGYRFERVIPKPHGNFPSAADFKAPARCEIEREGYTIVLAMGD